MKRKYWQNFILAAFLLVLTAYYLYSKGIISFYLLTPADLNPYAIWSNALALVKGEGNSFSLGFAVCLGIALIVSGILGGRFFCGWYCPIGAIQDRVNESAKSLKLLELKIPEKVTYVRYLLLLFFMVLSIIGMGASLAKFSPWGSLLGLTGGKAALGTIWLGLLLFVLILLVALFIPRFFCRTICPVGSVLALLASISPVALKKEGCIHCNKCLAHCAAAIKASEVSIDPSHCLMCGDCLGDDADSCNGFNLYFLGKKIKASKYWAFLTIVFIVIFLVLPLLFSSQARNTVASGSIYVDGKYVGIADGFNGKITVEVTVNADKITAIKVISQSESAGWAEEVFRELPSAMIKDQTWQVDAISGATYSSNGLKQAVANALIKAEVDTLK